MISPATKGLPNHDSFKVFCNNFSISMCCKDFRETKKNVCDFVHWSNQMKVERTGGTSLNWMELTKVQELKVRDKAIRVPPKLRQEWASNLLQRRFCMFGCQSSYINFPSKVIHPAMFSFINTVNVKIMCST